MPTNSKEYMRKYYQDHKDKFLEHALSKVICQTCGSKLLKSNLSRHQKTIKCKTESNLKVWIYIREEKGYIKKVSDSGYSLEYFWKLEIFKMFWWGQNIQENMQTITLC